MKLLFILILSFNQVYAADKIKLDLKQAYKIDKDFSFQVSRLVEESRCPRGEQCVWAGRVVVEVEFQFLEKTDKLNFAASHGLGRSANIVHFPISKKLRDQAFQESFLWKGKKYSLFNVLPYPGTGGKFKAIFQVEDYYVGIDVRTLKELQVNPATGALHITLDELAASKNLDQMAKETPIHVFCEAGKRAEKAKKILEAKGFVNVRNIGSWRDWNNLKNKK